jgi:hypothetical protein
LLEDDRGVVRDEVDAAKLLHELGAHAEHDAVEVAVLAVGKASADGRDRVAVTVLDDGGFLLSEGVPDFSKFGIKHRLARGTFMGRELLHHQAGFILAAVLQEPSGRFGTEDDQHDGEECEGDLNGKRRAELRVTGNKAKAIVDPIRRHLRKSVALPIG